jgi:hypothetical protein
VRRVQILLSLSLALAVPLSMTPDANADTYQTYNLAWSGATLGNGATATGVITLDLTTLINPTTSAGSLSGRGYFDIISDITSLSVTVTGAGVGDGTFTKANLCACSNFGSNTYWNTNGSTVIMEGNVLAQLTADLGDFNLFFPSPGPQGSAILTLTADAISIPTPLGLAGDPMKMTEFAPVATPEPSTISLMLTGVGLLGLMMVTRGTP